MIREAYPDPTATEGDWSAVDLAPEKALPRPVTLDEIKRNPRLKEMALLRLLALVGPAADERGVSGDSSDGELVGTPRCGVRTLASTAQRL